MCRAADLNRAYGTMSSVAPSGGLYTGCARYPGVVTVPDYRLFHFNHERIVAADVIEAPTDLDAIQQSSRLAGGGRAELWRGAEMLETFCRFRLTTRRER